MKISEKLKAAIEASGLKKKDVAEAAGISQVALSKYLGGIITPKQENLSKIAKALGVDLAYFYAEDGEGNQLSTMELEHWKRRALDAEGKLLALKDVWPSVHKAHTVLSRSFGNIFSREDKNEGDSSIEHTADEEVLEAAETLDDDTSNGGKKA